MEIELTEEQKQQIAYESCLNDFFKDNYGMILATYLEKNHDEFMEHVEEMYEDHEGKKIEYEWKATADN